jgi:5-methylcytosine-specific restriction endonuclease McrA
MKNTKNKSIVLLNADHTVNSFISFVRAVGLYLANKAIVVETEEDGEIIHPNLGIKKPVIMALRKYIYIPRKRVKLNRRNLLLRDKFQCQYCGCDLKNKKNTIDHIIPKSHPSSPGNTWTNLVICCEKCNTRKDNKLLHETDMKLLRKPFEPKMEDLLICDKRLEKALNKINNGLYFKRADN